jgi:hypothetical protein
MAKADVESSERKSYAEYINKQQIHPVPIDPESPSELYDVISQGILLW